MIKQLLILLFSWTFVYPVGAQTIDSSFYLHLELHGLKREQSAWWQQNNGILPQGDRRYARFLLQTGDLSAFNSVMRAEPEMLQDSCLIELASREFMIAEAPLRKLWFDQLEQRGLTGYSPQLYKLAQTDSHDWPPAFDSRLYPAFESMRSAQKKELWLAVTCDMLLPGAGKTYLGMPRHGFQTAFLMALLGWATYESVQRTGPKSGLSYLNYSALGTIYLSNLFGTAYQLKTRKINFKASYFNEVYKYTSLYSCD